MADGVALRLAGHDIRLKWHRLRRQRTDPVFTGKRLAEGLALGASMEVDLRLHAAGGFVVLHDETLEGETTGIGSVSGAVPEYLRSLRVRRESGAASDDPVLLLEDLSALMRTNTAPGAMVQLDLKETRDHLTERSVAAFAAAIGDHGPNIVVSGGDWAAVTRLAESVDGLRKGFDPCELPQAERLAGARDVTAFVAATESIGPDAGMIYLAYPLILKALALGCDLVGAFHAHGQAVDAWTLNTDHPNAAAALRALAGCRVDQITTDEPTRLEEFWRDIASGQPASAGSGAFR
jgi:glycerophosphoryl diester phosphodiesterase